MTTLYFVPSTTTASIICEVEGCALSEYITTPAEINSIYPRNLTVIDPLALREEILGGILDDETIVAYRSVRKTEEWLFIVADETDMLWLDDLSEKVLDGTFSSGSNILEYLDNEHKFSHFISFDAFCKLAHDIDDSVKDYYDTLATERYLNTYGRL